MGVIGEDAAINVAWPRPIASSTCRASAISGRLEHMDRTGTCGHRGAMPPARTSFIAEQDHRQFKAG